MRQRVILSIALMFVVASYAHGQAKARRNADRLAQELMRLQQAEDDAEAKKDLAALDRLLSDDFIFTAPTGAITNKQQLLADIKHDESGGGEAISYDEVKAHGYGQTAVVNYLLLVKGQDKDGKDFTNRYRNTVVWVKQQGRWRMAAIHVSRIRP